MGALLEEDRARLVGSVNVVEVLTPLREDTVLTRIILMRLRPFIAALVCFALVGTSEVASAQSDVTIEDDGPDTGRVLFISSSSTSLPLLAISTTAGIYIKRRKAWLREDIKRLETISLLDSFVEDNEPAVRMAVALGGGPELDQIAVIMDVEGLMDAEAKRRLRAQRDVIFGELDEGSSRGLLLYTAVMKAVEKPVVAEVVR